MFFEIMCYFERKVIILLYRTKTFSYFDAPHIPSKTRTGKKETFPEVRQVYLEKLVKL